MDGLDADVIAYYAELLQQEAVGLAQGACIIVLPGGRDVDEIVDRVGTVVRRAESLTAEEISDAQSERWLGDGPDLDVAWVVDAGTAVVLVEDNGFAGSLREVLAPLGWGGHLAASMYWCDANGANRLSLARDTEVESVAADHGTADDLA